MAEYKSNYTGEQIDAAIGKANTALQEELEPAFNASASKNITSGDITNWNAKAEVSDIPDVSNFITKDVNNLTNYELKVSTANNILMTLNNTTYELTLSLRNSANEVLNTQSVDLPLESVVVNGEYDSTNKKIVLELQNGNTIDVPVGDLINGLQSEITSSNKLDASLVDDSLSTNKFTNSTEKTTWNAKYDKPSTGIPKTDLAQAVQDSLDLADSAIQDVSGKEDTTNKVTTIDSTSTDTQYASAKAVWDLVSGLGGQDLEVSSVPLASNAFVFSENKIGVYNNNAINSIIFNYKYKTNDTVKYISNIRPIQLLYFKDVNSIDETSLEMNKPVYFASLLCFATGGNTFAGKIGIMTFYVQLNTMGQISFGAQETYLNEWTLLYEYDQIIKGNKYFNNIPRVSSYVAPTQNTELVAKKYVDDLVGSISGGGDVEVGYIEYTDSNNPFIFKGKSAGAYLYYLASNTEQNFYFKKDDSDTVKNVTTELATTNFVLFISKTIDELEETSISNPERFATLISMGYSGKIRRINFYMRNTKEIYYTAEDTNFNGSLLYGNQTIRGNKTFESLPKTYSYIVPSNDTDFVAKKYVDDSIASAATTYTGYDATKTQVLKNINGVLTWVDEV